MVALEEAPLEWGQEVDQQQDRGGVGQDGVCACWGR